MLRYAESLNERGLLQRAESLKSDAEGVRLRVRDGERSVVDGPFAEAKEMIGASSCWIATRARKRWRWPPNARPPPGPPWKCASWACCFESASTAP